ncbi:MAG: DUF4351 domain-containing protein [Thermoguttaceae bacterium]|jgi:hypothetical protein|nr:DUF4351 domain-containing protein [Thermoguttaceae bacterium]
MHFRETLEKYFPSVAAAIDWSVPSRWHDKELSQILAQTGRRAGRVDLLTEVQLSTREKQWILLHVEVQSAREAGFEARLARYHGGLSWVFQRRVASLVVLADLDEHWRPSEDVFRLGDFESRLRFPVCKLIERVDRQWREDDPSLAVQVARAQIAALRTTGDGEGRYRTKWQLVRNLYHLGYNADELREAFRLIDWMMSLPEALSRKFVRELTALEEELNMPYVTSVERIAEARGRAEGEVQGSLNILLRLLARVCGPLPQEVEQRVRRLPVQRLEALAEAAVDFRSLHDAQVWLDTHERPTQ